MCYERLRGVVDSIVLDVQIRQGILGSKKWTEGSNEGDEMVIS